VAETVGRSTDAAEVPAIAALRGFAQKLDQVDIPLLSKEGCLRHK